MTPIDVMALMGFFILKHFICDFWYQPPFQWQNKGTYGHIGGIAHSAQHAIPTWLFLMFYASFPVALGLAIFEFIAHYHIDWAKMNINKRMGWGPTTHEEFWILLGVDQLLHYVTYMIMIGCMI
jgi:hypothetical protein